MTNGKSTISTKADKYGTYRGKMIEDCHCCAWAGVAQPQMYIAIEKLMGSAVSRNLCATYLGGDAQLMIYRVCVFYHRPK